MLPDRAIGRQGTPPPATAGRSRLGRLLSWPAAPGVLAALLGLSLGLLLYQTPTSYRLAPAEADPRTISGFSAPERNEGGSFRWTTGEASLRLPPIGTPATLRITAIGWRPDNLPSPTLTVLIDGQPVAAWRTGPAEATYEASLPRHWLTPTGVQVTLRSETFTPGPQDRRTLGVAVRQVEMSVAGDTPVAPPLAALALSALVPLLLQRAGRHLGLPAWPSLMIGGVATLALATQAAGDRAGWLLAAPGAVLAVAALATAAAVAPPLVRRVRPSLRRALGAIRLGLLPAWPEWEPLAAEEATAAQRRAARLAVASLAVSLVLLHLLSLLVPVEPVHWQSYAWGLRYIDRFPLPLTVVLAVPVLALAVPAVSRRAWALGAGLLARLPSSPRRLNAYALTLLGALLALPLLWLLRIQTGRFGDSDELQRKIAGEGAIWREREPLDFYLHVQAYRLLNPVTGWDVPTVYAIMSCLAGALFIITLVLLVALLARRRPDRWLAAALIAGAGSAQLYFGYVESYTLVAAGLALYLLLGLLCLAGRLGVGWPATMLAVAATLHPIAIAAGPSLAVLLLHRWQARGYGWAAAGRLLLPTLAGLVVPFLLLIALFFANGYTAERWEIARRQFGGADQRTFKPLLTVTTHLERYPIISGEHPRALLNQQLLIAPFGWPLALALLAACRPRRLWREPRFVFLLLAAAATTAFVCLWNPDLGPRQDWDLLAIGALPSMALAAYLLVTLVPRGPDRRYCGLLLLAASLYHTGLWVLGNSQLLTPWLGG